MESTPDNAVEKSNQKQWLLGVLVFVVGLLIFWPGAKGEFIYDDHVDIRNVDNVFTPGAWTELFQTASAQLYRPVKYLSYYLDNVLFGWKPEGWHWQSFIWHALNGALVFLLAKRWGASVVAAALGGLWFAIHPVHAEAVVWISSRASLQSTLGVLLMLFFYDRWRQGERQGDLVGLLLAGFIGFFSKEDALMVFPVIGLYEVFVRRQNPFAVLKDKKFLVPVISLGVVAVVYVGLRQSILTGLKQGGWEAGFSGWLSTLPVILTTYLRQLVWPDRMCIDQPVDYAAGFGVAFILSTVVLLILAGVMVMRKQAWARWQFALGFFFITLVPVMGIIPINQPRADRFLYLPSVAAALCVAWLWDWAVKQQKLRLVALTFMAMTLGWFGWRSWDYSKTFLNDRVLWEQVIAVNEKSYRGFANLAASENNAGRPQNGLQLVEEALKLKTDYPEGWVIKGYSLSMLGKVTEAEAEYRKAINEIPTEARWLYLLADLLERQKRNAEAMELYERIAKVRPAYVEARLSAGVLAATTGQLDKAREHWEAVLRYDPKNEAARKNLEILAKQRK
jgi:tetratricopeptide (TPR) repeat protein